MPSATVRILGVSCASLGAAYLALIVATIFFATLRTDYVAQMTALEARVSSLESRYLGDLAIIQSLDPQTLGYAAPKTERFVSAETAVLTRAN